jgi:hypothetical protein
MKATTIIFASLLMMSCGIIKPKTIYVTRDSLVTVTQTVIRDSIITLPGDTITITLPAIHDTVFIARSGRASAAVSISRGQLKVTANCDEQNIIISRLQEQLHHYQTAQSDSSQTTVVTVKHIPSFYKFTFWGFFALAAVITALLLKNNNIWLTLIATLGSIFRTAAKKSDRKA